MNNVVVSPRNVTSISALLKLYEGKSEEVRVHTLDGSSHPGKVRAVNESMLFLSIPGGGDVCSIIPLSMVCSISGVITEK